MQIMYYRTAWSDLKNSPGWFKKLMLLALLNFIPIFGQIVTFGYLYGWARDIAWGVHNPLPAQIFANEDGKLYRRGFFALVITFIFSLVPGAIDLLSELVSGTGVFGLLAAASESSVRAAAMPSSFAIVTGSLLGIVAFIAELAVILFGWVGIMRMSIYDDLSAGLQIGTLWKMIRRDMGGLLKILGMSILIGLIIGVVFIVLISLVTFVFVAGAFAVGQVGSSNAQAATALVGAGLIGVPFFLAIGFFMAVGVLFAETLVARAVGYWTSQFNVAQWRGKNDPLPFEYQTQAQQYPPQYR